MKKIILLTLVILLSADIFINAEDLPKCESMEVIELSNYVHGNYLEYSLDGGKYFEEVFLVKNISGEDIKYAVTLYKVSMNPQHILTYCIGATCRTLYGYQQSQTWTSEQLDLKTDEITSSAVSHLVMNTGEDSSTAVEGVDTIRVTYRRVGGALNDVLSFYCIWNFHTSSIEIMKDISNQILPNPAMDYLNLTIADNIDVVEVFDMNGSKMLSRDVNGMSNISLDISTFPIGSYLGYNIRAGKQVELFKFVKQ